MFSTVALHRGNALQMIAGTVKRTLRTYWTEDAIKLPRRPRIAVRILINLFLEGHTSETRANEHCKILSIVRLYDMPQLTVCDVIHHNVHLSHL